MGTDERSVKCLGDLLFLGRRFKVRAVSHYTSSVVDIDNDVISVSISNNDAEPIIKLKNFLRSWG